MKAFRVSSIPQALTLAFVLVWTLSPIYVGVMTSLSTRTSISDVPPHWFPSPISLDGYAALLPGATGEGTSDQFFAAFLNSVRLAVIATTLTLTLSVLSGYAFARLRFRGRRVVLLAVVGTIVIPLFLLIVPLFRLMSQLHLIGTLPGVIALYVAAYTPLGIWLFYNYVRDMPVELEEAARVDGCSRFQAFRKVVLPQMRGGIAALTAILLLSTWGEFTIPLIFASNADTQPLTVIITQFVGKYSLNVPVMMAAGVLSMLLPAVIALVLARHIRAMLSGWGHQPGGGMMASVFDVARHARVSVATASRVLSGSEYPVSRATRERVLDAAALLEYSPNALAKAMATGRTGIVGVLVGDASDPYFAAIVRGIEDVARQHGKLVVVCNSDRDPAIELQYLRALNDYRVDGLIFAGGGLTDDGYVREIRKAVGLFRSRGAACVALAAHLFPSYRVLIDNEGVVRDAVAYLHSLGHRRIAFLSGPPLLTTTGLRLAGYRAAGAELGLAEEPGYVLEGDYTFEGGVLAARVIGDLRPRPTALLASNDMMATGAIVGLRQLGVAIPDDVSVMGIDDIPTAIAVHPALTTVAIPLHELGATGMESLLRLGAGELLADDGVTLPHHIVVRDSVRSLGGPASRATSAG